MVSPELVAAVLVAGGWLAAEAQVGAPATAPASGPTSRRAAAQASAPGAAGEAERLALRRTPLVKLFEACRGSVVTVLATWTEKQAPEGEPAPPASGPASRLASPPASGPVARPGAAGRAVTITHTERGSGFVIHPDGFVLTCSHGLRHGGRLEARFADGRTFRLREIARDDTHDVALLKIDRRGRFVPLRLGHSGDLMVGEPAYAIGDPFGFGLSLGQGVVTGVRRSTKTDFTLLTGAIQTDAGINPGVSGGPLLNVFGEVVGLATSQKRDADGIGFAVAIDDIRAAFGEMLSAEQRFAFVLGLDVAAEGPARVTRVAVGSPAAAAGVREGDVVLAVGKAAVRDAIDFHLALVGRRGGERLPLKLRRAEQAVEVTATLGKVEPLAAEKAEGLAGGLDYAAYEGQWERVPDLAGLRPAATGTMATFGLGGWAGRDGFALRLAGYVQASADGLYQFYVESDDGSRLYVGDRLVVDNDGLHAATERRGLVHLKAGLHRLRVEFFDAGGEKALNVQWEGPGFRKQPVAANALFHAAKDAESAPASRPAAASAPASRPLTDPAPSGAGVTMPARSATIAPSGALSHNPPYSQGLRPGLNTPAPSGAWLVAL